MSVRIYPRPQDNLDFVNLLVTRRIRDLRMASAQNAQPDHADFILRMWMLIYHSMASSKERGRVDTFHFRQNGVLGRRCRGRGCGASGLGRGIRERPAQSGSIQESQRPAWGSGSMRMFFWGSSFRYLTWTLLPTSSLRRMTRSDSTSFLRATCSFPEPSRNLNSTME